MPYMVINIYYSVTCYTNHINSTRIQSIASMALTVFPDAVSTLETRDHHQPSLFGVFWPSLDEYMGNNVQH